MAALYSWPAAPYAALCLVVYIGLVVLVFVLRIDDVRVELVFFRHESALGRRQFSKPGRAAWDKEIERLYTRMIAKSSNGPYLVDCSSPIWGALEIEVRPDVYAPRIFTDSMWFAEKLAGIVGGKRLLEIGTGTGLVAIAAARCGATSCVVTDVNRYAVENAQANVQRLGLGGQIQVKQGDMFAAVDEQERFDVVFWAHPFNRAKVRVTSELRKSGSDYKYEGLESYVSGAWRHIGLHGKMLLGTGDSADVTRIIRLACKYRMNVDVLSQDVRLLGEDSAKDLGVEYYLCEWRRWE